MTGTSWSTDDVNPVTVALRDAQVPTAAHQWTPDHGIEFTPATSSCVFGDGRALFRVTTVNSRPRWWLVRGCSTWTAQNDPHDGLEPIADHIDDIVDALSEEFGGVPMRDGEDEYDVDATEIVYPAIDDRIGTFWDHLDWPDLPGVGYEPHPNDALRTRGIRILAA